MDVHISTDSLRALIAPLARVVPSKPSHPVMASILLTANEEFGEIEATAYNGEVGVTTRAQLTELTRGGSVLVPGALLAGLANKLPSGATAQLSETSRGFGLASGGAFYDLGVEYGPDDFPELPTDQHTATLGVAASALADALKKVAYAAGSEASGHPELECVALTIKDGQAEVAALDGHRMAICPVAGGDGNDQVLLPLSLVADLAPLLRAASGDDDAVELLVSGSLIHIKIGSSDVIGRRFDGKYPPYQKLMLNKFANEFVASREELVSAIERCSLIANQLQGTVTIKFDAAGRTMAIASENDRGAAMETLMIDVPKGKDLEVHFKASYLLEAIRRLDGESVRFLTAADPNMIIRLAGSDSDPAEWQGIMPRAKTA